MKIVLNIKELLEEGKINQAEYDKLLSLSKNQTGSLALNLLFGFGIIMVCIGVITLTQTASAALITGLLTFLIGLFIQFKGTKEWSVLSSCCSISGVLIFAAGINLWVLWAYESDFLGLANSLDFLYAQILTTLILMVASAFLLKYLSNLKYLVLSGQEQVIELNYCCFQCTSISSLLPFSFSCI